MTRFSSKYCTEKVLFPQNKVKKLEGLKVIKNERELVVAFFLLCPFKKGPNKWGNSPFKIL